MLKRITTGMFDIVYVEPVDPTVGRSSSPRTFGSCRSSGEQHRVRGGASV